MLLSSCSRIRLGYNYADWLLESKASEYLSLSSAADRQLSDDIDAYHLWHRKEMLPTYATLCRKLALGLRGIEPAEENIRLVTPMLNGVYASTVEPAIAPAATALMSLDEKGIASLEKKYAEETAKNRKRYLEDPEGANERRIKRTIKSMTDFTGPLSEDQKLRVKELTLGVTMPYAAWIADREQRKADLIQLLREKKSRQLVEASLRDWWLKPRVGGSKSDAARMDQEQVKVFFLGIVELLTPEQREKAARRVEDYAADFEALSQN